MLLRWLFREDEVPPGIKARSIDDFMIDEKVYKGDFDLQARWDSSVTELERLSLLGIAAYGFLITTMSSEKSSVLGFPLFAKFREHPYLPAIGILCFAGAALACNVLSCKCMKWQLDILRGFARLSSDRWIDQDKAEIQKRVIYFQDKQRHQLRWNKLLLRVSTGLLSTGAMLTAITFALVLL